MGDINIKESVIKLWTDLGRDPKKLNLDKLRPGELLKAQRQLKTIQMSFDMLLKEDGNYNMAIGLLTEVFVKEENGKENEECCSDGCGCDNGGGE